MMQLSEETRKKIVELCKRHKIREISLFGSRMRGDHRPDSDYDFLIEFDPRARISLFDYGRAWVDFEELMGAKIDLIDNRGLKPFLREPVLAEAKLIYEE
ncbi:MAG: nucleotidyltransferase domain-containing protein [Pyrinomonadaceae bacterium]